MVSHIFRTFGRGRPPTGVTVSFTRLRGMGEQLRTEEVEPQVLVGLDPEEPLANRREDGHLGYGVGVEVMHLYPIVVRERPHEAACRHPEPPLMEGGEADHVAHKRGRFLLVPRRETLRVCFVGARVKQSPTHQGL
jgi:hypothetical protein